MESVLKKNTSYHLTTPRFLFLPPPPPSFSHLPARNVWDETCRTQSSPREKNETAKRQKGGGGSILLMGKSFQKQAREAAQGERVTEMSTCHEGVVLHRRASAQWALCVCVCACLCIDKSKHLTSSEHHHGLQSSE